MVVYACKCNTWQAESEELQVWGQSGLQRKFQATLGYSKSLSKNYNSKRESRVS